MIQVHIVIQISKSLKKVSNTYTGTDASEAQEKLESLNSGLVQWFRLQKGRPVLIREIDYEANKRQAAQLKALAKAAAAADLKAATEKARALGVLDNESEGKADDEDD